MLMIHTSLLDDNIGPSELYTTHDIKKGGIVYLQTHHDQVFTQEQIDEMPDMLSKNLEGLFFQFSGKFILPIDNARHISKISIHERKKYIAKHGRKSGMPFTAPNVKPVLSPDGMLMFVASKKIDQDEQIVVDYDALIRLSVKTTGNKIMKIMRDHGKI